jgi:Predicted membrane-associated Zn-dependent proteases 1
MQILVSIITLSLIITPLVVLHELGHYLTAKYFKVRVLEFGLGFPPKIFSIWTQEIVYNLDNHVQINSHELEKDQIIYVELSENKITYISEKNNLKNLIPLKIVDIFEDRLKVKSMNWSINLIPFGGFVKLFGEEKNSSKDSLSSSSYLGRFIIIFSGSFINFLLPSIMMFLCKHFYW